MSDNYGKKVLLIADDEEMNRRIIKKFLKDDFYVLEASDGEEALQILNSKHIDLVLLDIIMPKVDGLMVLEKLKSNNENDNIGVLVATAAKEKTERAALSLGADDVVSKPYDPLVIKKRLFNILAAKEVNYKEKLLSDKDYIVLIKNLTETLNKDIGTHLDEILACTKIIADNNDNAKLVKEIGEKIIENVTKIEKTLNVLK